MFQFPAFAPAQSGYPAFSRMGSPIRTSPGQWLFAPNRCFSQLTASFFASLSLGIHRPPFCFPFFTLPFWKNMIPYGTTISRSICFSSATCQRTSGHESNVENKGLEPLTPCVQGRCSEPTELIPQDTGTSKVLTVVPG